MNYSMKQKRYKVNRFIKYFFWTSKNSCSMLWLSGGKGQGKPNKTAVSADTANDTDLIQKQLKLHGLYEL